MVDLFEKGAMPVAGGVLDQPAWLVKFASQLKREDAKVLESIRNGN